MHLKSMHVYKYGLKTPNLLKFSCKLILVSYLKKEKKNKNHND